VTGVGLPLKSNACMAMLDDQGFALSARPRVVGMFLLDTRHLSDYAWDFVGFDLAETQLHQRGFTQFWSRFTAHAQTLLIRREFTLGPEGFDEVLTISNEALTAQELVLALRAEADFVDTFELRGRIREIGRNPVLKRVAAAQTTFEYTAQDGVVVTTTLVFDGFGNGVAMALQAGEVRQVGVTGTFSTTLRSPMAHMPVVEWTSAAAAMRGAGSAAMQQAFSDVEVLASGSAHGTYLVAGIPNFATPFGRDGLISAWFLLDAAPGIARGTLRLLAANQGVAFDDVREEEPGKIPHELRYGELARCADVPFGRYYGTTDATALFVILLRDYVRKTGDTALLEELAPVVQKAMGWIEARQDHEGLIRYRASRIGKGLSNTSWKDSDDGMFYADGSFAKGQIAVIEVQAYTVAALQAAADLNDLSGRGDMRESSKLRAQADDLAALVDLRFWNDDLGLHAIAVDGENRQVDLVSSNPGHLLWAGCLVPARAAQVAKRMLQPDMWSGWGLRTAATGASRYQPLSYHNGSVWPHDTMMFAAGLLRYGFVGEARIVAQAIHDVAIRQPGYQLPELFGGYARDGEVPPLIYIETCRPQAWAAAAMVWAAKLIG
jgi:glycogen debranching enzyme